MGDLFERKERTEDEGDSLKAQLQRAQSDREKCVGDEAEKGRIVQKVERNCLVQPKKRGSIQQLA